ncbi:hypothetical protein RND71_026423 [Anisodus tanguticus]|uniref:Uncharacterized protein n=1 Tax=Anisodus tanguticus TaxID=243964 RepID=A0AAE1RN91_9SOLA|nr:hypothetical protein RND71_026423 [Anisodus tanguticus]
MEGRMITLKVRCIEELRYAPENCISCNDHVHPNLDNSNTMELWLHIIGPSCMGSKVNGIFTSDLTNIHRIRDRVDLSILTISKAAAEEARAEAPYRQKAGRSYSELELRRYLSMEFPISEAAHHSERPLCLMSHLDLEAIGVTNINMFEVDTLLNTKTLNFATVMALNWNYSNGIINEKEIKGRDLLNKVQDIWDQEYPNMTIDKFIFSCEKYK